MPRSRPETSAGNPVTARSIDALIDGFRAEFPELIQNILLVNPLADRHGRYGVGTVSCQLGERFTGSGRALRDLHRLQTSLEQLVKRGSPFTRGLHDSRLGIRLGFINPVSAPRTWAEKATDQVVYSEPQEWARPDRALLDRHDDCYAHYTAHHEIGHGVFHRLAAQEPRLVASAGFGEGRKRQTPFTTEAESQKQECYSDLRGAVALLRDKEPERALETVRRLAHLRALATVHSGDLEHWTGRAFKHALSHLGTERMEEWRKPGMEGAKAQLASMGELALGEKDIEALATMRRDLIPGDTMTPARALERLGKIGGTTQSTAVYELARDYVEAVAAIVPADRYEQLHLLQARAQLRRNPLAAHADQQFPRIEALVNKVRLFQSAAPAANTERPAPPLRRAGL